MNLYVILIAGLLLLLTLGALWLSFRKIYRNTRLVDDNPDLWVSRVYTCPGCNQVMSPGYCMAGRGLIWADKDAKGPGPLAHIGRVLDNTMSLRIRPALNMSWRCYQCGLLMIDHSKMVVRDKG